ncbi:exosporium leader peptide-containing protein, partial [Bacillus toyonensis]
MLNEERWKGLIPDEYLSASALDPNLIGPTLPPIPPFTFPTGPTGSTGPFATNTNAFIVNFTTTALI